MRGFLKIWYLTKFMVKSFSPFIIFFSIDIWINLLTALSSIFRRHFPLQKLSWVLCFFVGHLIAKPNYSFHNIIEVVDIFLYLWHVFILSVLGRCLNILYKEMAFIFNQNLNTCNNLFLPNRGHEFTVLISASNIYFMETFCYLIHIWFLNSYEGSHR